ncbi:MAG: PepSY-associated TM helix domain-containing protein, partial [Pseudomonadota bacterium]
MNRARRQRLYDLHSWTGVLTGLFIYVVCFTGTVALFASEAALWIDEVEAAPERAVSVSIDALVQELMADGPAEGETTYLSVALPASSKPFFEGYAIVQSPDGG